MIKATLLGLAILAAVMTLVPALAESEYLHPPLKQLKDNVQLEKIMCNGEKIMTWSQSERPVCVTLDTSIKMPDRTGWKAALEESAKTDKAIMKEEPGEFVPQIIIIKSPATISEPSKIGDIAPSPKCLFQNEITLETPNRVRVGEVFNVTASFSFDKEDPIHDKKYWDAFCNKLISIRYPLNYEAMGDGLNQGSTFIHDYYKPPTVSHGMTGIYIEYNQQPITFQMRINDLEDAVYDGGGNVSSASGYVYDLSMLSDDDLYDHGWMSVVRHTGNPSTKVYTSINNGFVYLSDTEFPSGQDDDKPVKFDRRAWFPPVVKVMPHDPPLKQLKDNVQLEKIMCNDEKILIWSQSGRPVCVTLDTSIKLLDRTGWKAVLEESAKTDKAIMKEEPGEFVPQIITIKSPLPPIPESIKLGPLSWHSHCLFQNEITLEIPKKVRVGEVFNVTASFSFVEDPINNKEYWDTYVNASRLIYPSQYGTDEFWDHNCDTDFDINYPPNYEAMGGGLEQGHIYINDDYKPLRITQGMYIPDIKYNQSPLTFQMKINDLKDIVYDADDHTRSSSGHVYDLSLLSGEDTYDYGYFKMSRSHGLVSAVAYTSINNGFVYLSDTEFPSGQDDIKPIKNAYYQ